MVEIDERKKEQILKYIDFLFEENEKYNLVSRKMLKEEFFGLVEETILLSSYLKGKWIVDAGSGNGLLGISLSILFPEKQVYLVESKPKKANFLKIAAFKLGLRNIEVFSFSITEFFQKKRGWGPGVLVARGFPENLMLVSFLLKRFVGQVVIITSYNKIKKIEKDLENLKQKIYNIPSRDNLKILKMENVSRET